MFYFQWRLLYNIADYIFWLVVGGVQLCQVTVLGPILFILYSQPLPDVTTHHSVSYHMFADDTELYKSDSPSEAFSLTQIVESCISDVKVWIVRNKLQLNDNKTEILLLLEFIFLLHCVWVRVTSPFF